MKVLLIPLLVILVFGAGIQWVERLAFWDRNELAQTAKQLQELEAQLAHLPQPSGVRSGNRIGFQTDRDASESELWLELELPTAAPIDSLVLVPAIVKTSSGNMPGYGFPSRFQILGWNAANVEQLLVNQTKADLPNPGLYPLLFKFPTTELKRIRLKVVSPWHPEGPAVLALSELLVFSGNRNLALLGSVTAGSSREARPTWGRQNLMDMNTPLGLPIEPSEQPNLPGYQSMPSLEQHSQKCITVELSQQATLDEIRLVPVRRPEMPSWLAYGFPTGFMVETALKVDFSDAVVVFDHRKTKMPSPGQNMVCLPLLKTEARFVRVTATELWERSGDYVFALAELQAYAKGENVALGGKVTATDSFNSSLWSPAALTDGLTADGKILDLPEWFGLLDLRRKMEAERSELTQHRQELLESAERVLVGGSIGTAVCAVLGASVSVWRVNRNRKQERVLMRERLARDLHDELGSNLGSIALIASFGSQADATTESMRADFTEIEQVARESIDSMHEIITLLESSRSMTPGTWALTLKKMGKRLLRGVEFEYQTCDLAWTPDPETRRNLYLFCKEALHNAARHAQPTKVRLAINSSASGLDLLITDNGKGFDLKEQRDGFGLENLQRRATAMKGTLLMESAPGKGTCLHLQLRQTRRWSSI